MVSHDNGPCGRSTVNKEGRGEVREGRRDDTGQGMSLGFTLMMRWEHNVFTSAF